MLEHLTRRDQVQNRLDNLEPWQLDQVYLRVFNTDDGELILQDLANRCYVDIPTPVGSGCERAEGMRDVYLSIITRMMNTVTRNKEERNEES